ncbi:LCP family protein [Micromonospora chalcea]|uniref:LCP family protein n=1 Tax=Micromonospora chalcea TaxID=1874 RepID=UPI0004C422F5|nr:MULTISPECIES: LCP family protein [Micromonospora]MCT2281601.1 LCP family protein [Micromonospora chalcea]
MIEDELRAAFARLEESTPPVGPVRAAVDRAVIMRRRRRRRVRLAGTALAVAAVALVGFTAMAPRPPAPTAALPLAAPEPEPGGALNLLLLGVDQAPGSRRADSILLVHVPADRSRLYLVSLPRDLLVPMPPQGGTEKLNATFSRAAGSGTDLAAGFRATRQAVARLTGVRVDAGAVLTWSGARELTDAVGGVPVCLPEPVRSVHTERRFPSGCQRLDGAAAVDLLRQRYGLRDGGLDRDRNAARYAAGLLRQMRERGTATDPAQLGRLLVRIGTAGTIDAGDLSLPALVGATGRAAAAEPVALSLPVRDEWTGRGFEPDRTLAPGFLDALRADRLGEWAAAHPARVTSLR